MRETSPFSDSYIDAISGDPFKNYFTPIWDEVCQTVTIGSLLDVGCGNGLFTAALKPKLGCRLSGVDGSPHALRLAKEAGFDALSLVEDFSTMPLPFDDAQFDFVVCKDVLEHLLDPQRLLAEMSRVLKAGGALLVHVPNHFSLYGRLRFLFTNDIDTWRYYPKSTRFNFPHIRFYTHEEIRSMLRAERFTPIGDYSHYFFSMPKQHYLPRRVRMRLARFLTQRAPSQFAAGFTILARKHEESSV